MEPSSQFVNLSAMMLGGRSSCPGGNIYVWPFLPPAACRCHCHGCVFGQPIPQGGRPVVDRFLRCVHALRALNRPTKEDRPCSHHLEKNRIGIATKGNAHGRSMLLPSDGRFSEATVPLAKSGPPLLLSARCCRQTLRRRGHFLRVPDYLPFQNERQHSIQRTTTLGLVIKLKLVFAYLLCICICMQVSKIFYSLHQLIGLEDYQSCIEEGKGGCTIMVSIYATVHENQ